ncbi:hypothetical protein KKE45_03930 [Patescibacteria group bacterium]|nr:hypothetical protein [Patescibacteria group bacterium]
MAKKRYEDVREKIFGERGWIDNVRSKVKGILPNQIKYFTETFVNLRRFFKGVVSVENLSFLVQRRLEELRNSRIRIEVLEREDFLSKKFCQEFLAGVDKKRVETNKATVSRLLDNEVFGEIGCLHCLRIDGVSLKLFHHLVGWMGGRSNVLLAGDKQANGGCATFESSGSNPFKPFLGSFADDEERLYWQGEDSDFVEEGGELKEKRGRRFSSFVRAIKGGKIGSRLHARIFWFK